MIILRIDVDYPYQSRIKSMFYTALGIRFNEYLKNSKNIARMINKSSEDVKAYWFFTFKTLPDSELLELLDNKRHEIGLHIVNNPYKELKILEERTGKKINYYTIHGTTNLFARLIWRRWRHKVPYIPKIFSLKPFKFKALRLDKICYRYPTEMSMKIAEKSVRYDYVLFIHPIWLFRKGRINPRGPYYNILRKILNVDREMNTITIRKKLFFRIAKDKEEYIKDIAPMEEFLEKLRDRGVDIFTFIEREWVSKPSNLLKQWAVAEDNVALLHIESYESWFKKVGKKTRNMVRKAIRRGIKTKTIEPDDELAKGIWEIYNETPIRQGRYFLHYGIPLEKVRNISSPLSQNSIYIGAYLGDELVGFLQLIYGKDTASISQILSLQRHWDKAVNNTLISKAVEICVDMKIPWMIYARMGNHPSLDRFKRNNGFIRFQIRRYYIPLTRKGQFIIKLGLHRDLKDILPQKIKYLLIPIYNWLSRLRVKLFIKY